MSDQFTDNIDKQRFELLIDGWITFAAYQRQEGIIRIDYVEAPAALRGTGAAGRLMQHIADIASAENRKIIPICTYAAAWLRKYGL